MRKDNIDIKFFFCPGFGSSESTKSAGTILGAKSLKDRTKGCCLLLNMLTMEEWGQKSTYREEFSNGHQNSVRRMPKYTNVAPGRTGLPTKLNR